jgi:hypothetical protein
MREIALPSESVMAISKGVDTVTKNLLLFVPPLVLLVIQLLFQFSAYVVPNIWFELVVSFIVGLIGFMAYGIVVDMTNDTINGNPLDLNKSLNVITSRLPELILIAIVAALCALTILLIPLAYFFRTITIIEKTDTNQTISKTVDFVRNNLGDVIVFVLITIVVTVLFTLVFSLIPFVGAYVGDLLNMLFSVVFTAASVHLYTSLKTTTPNP